MDTLFLIALIIASIVAIAFNRRTRPGPAPRQSDSARRGLGGGELPGHGRSAQTRGRVRAKPIVSLAPAALHRGAHRLAAHGARDDAGNARRHEVTMLERGLVVLEIIVGIAPLLGLVGTIYGLILLFHSQGMDLTVQASNNGFARGISTALNATLLGLLVAIPALIGWSYFNRKVETLSVEIEGLCDEFLRKSYRNGEVTEGLPKIAKRA
jgi:biopolymer transport protein ExbB/TolQ